MPSITDDTRISSLKELAAPSDLLTQIPLDETVAAHVTQARGAIHNVLAGEDDRLVVVVGPCSIHDVDAAIDYAKRLQPLAQKLNDRLLVVMRVYFEKPRTSIGWEGLIYDPHLDGSHRIDQGIRLGRKLMLDIANIGLPIGIEALDLISPQYLQDLVSWTAVGARTTESPTHRKLASGISSAIGFKNNVVGEVSVAINAIRSASANHSFISITDEGNVAVFRTEGNPHCHVILRGGKLPNYDVANVKICEEELRGAGIIENIMIDCSHGNSEKDHFKQLNVLEDVANQIADGNNSIIGVMLESNLNEGNQPIPDDLSEIRPGVSITDACISWESTETALRQFAKSISDATSNRNLKSRNGN